MIIVFTGNGKGKTTASLGQAVRALGRGKRVLMVQFIKGPWKSGEDFLVKILNKEALEKSEIGSGEMVFKKMGLGFVGILGDKLPFSDHQKAAEDALEYIKSEFDNFDVVIMDEINVAVSLKLIEPEKVLKVIENTPEEKIVLLTGRGAPESFIKRADLATEMKEIKHPFNDGKLAKINIEF
jgi:cob(I)alamin adenosyltransferase